MFVSIEWVSVRAAQHTCGGRASSAVLCLHHWVKEVRFAAGMLAYLLSHLLRNIYFSCINALPVYILYGVCTFGVMDGCEPLVVAGNCR